MTGHFVILLFALLIGVVAGLRSLTAPAVVAWGAYLLWFSLAGHGWTSWLGNINAVVILTVLAALELVTDKLPKTPARTAAAGFVPRIVTGGFSGAVLGSVWGHPWASLGAGIIGAVIGTLGGHHARKRLVALIGGKDLPVALLEDAVAILGGLWVVASV